MLAMALRLRSSWPVDARGMAYLTLLLRDGAGPCYVPSRRDTLAIELQTVTLRLEVRP